MLNVLRKTLKLSNEFWIPRLALSAREKCLLAPRDVHRISLVTESLLSPRDKVTRAPYLSVSPYLSVTREIRCTSHLCGASLSPKARHARRKSISAL